MVKLDGDHEDGCDRGGKNEINGLWLEEKKGTNLGYAIMSVTQ